MKLLSEYLSTKVKLQDDFQGFPLSIRLKDIVEFLKNKMFDELKLEEEEFVFDQMCQKNKKQLFSYGDAVYDGEQWVRFCDTGTITEHNPIFFCRVTNKQKLKSDYNYYLEYPDTNPDKPYKAKLINSIEEFKDIVDKHFDW